MRSAPVDSQPGDVASPGTAWGGALSILLPFMCGLQPTRLRALATSAGYYLGALGPYVISGLLVTQVMNGWERLVTGCAVLAFSATEWSLMRYGVVVETLRREAG